MEQKNCPAPKRIMLLITIVNREEGEAIAGFYRSRGLTFNMISPGFGAAGLEILDYLGLTETEKDMVISIASEDKIYELLPLIKDAFHLDTPGAGIAFTIPISGISGPKALHYVTGFGEES